MDDRLDDAVALVTGAGRGIGRATAEALAAAGAEVFLAARTAAEIDEAAGAIRRSGGRATAMAADISREEDVTALFGAIARSRGRLDILVNNAGIGIFGPAERFTAEDFDRVMRVNLRGTFISCREALKIMAPRRRGTIVNISSIVGVKGYPGQAAYTASKHGVMGLTKSLAAEAQPLGIRVTAVLPGGVDTAMVRDARPDLDPAALLRPEDVARTVLFLVTLPERAWIDEIVIRRKDARPFHA